MRLKYKKPNKHRIFAIGGLIISALICFFNFTPSMRNVRSLPSAIFAENIDGLNLALNGIPNSMRQSVAAAGSDDETLAEKELNIKLFGLITLRSIPVYVGERKCVIPCGDAIGISIHTKGLLVVGNGSFTDAGGKRHSPSSDAGIRAGDRIISVNGIEVNTSEEMQRVIDGSTGGVGLTVERNGKVLSFNIVPVNADDGRLKIGAWVRDSTIGIGTLSFIDSATGKTAALGHAVVDSDTGEIITVLNGSMCRAKLIGIKKGRNGDPGELQGSFDDKCELISDITGNGELGIFGTVRSEYLNSLQNNALTVAFPNEVRLGPAVILTSLDNSGVKEYSCEIIKLYKQSYAEQKGIIIQITDESLLSAAGGIVQGMSGSPILQDGMLVGVVTHVFVNDPTRGYGVYAYWMTDD